MMSILKEECSKVGFEMPTQKTNVLSNGIQEVTDNRKTNIGNVQAEGHRGGKEEA